MNWAMTDESEERVFSVFSFSFVRFASVDRPVTFIRLDVDSLLLLSESEGEKSCSRSRSRSRLTFSSPAIM